MSVCNVSFSVVLDGQFSNYKTKGNIEKRGEVYRISFCLQESGLSYAFSIFSNKVTLSAKGELSYTFTLRLKEKFNFVLGAMGAPIYCEVECKNLEISLKDADVEVSSRYTLNAGGNVSKNEFKLKVDFE